MNALKNKVQLIGNLGTTPEIISMDSGKKLAKFSLATNDYYKSETGEKIQQTQWHNILAWGKLATIIEQYVDKGQEVVVEGKLTNRSYVNKDGEKRFITEVVIHDLLMLNKS